MARHQGWKPHLVLRRNGNTDIWMARAGKPGDSFVPSIVDVNCTREHAMEFVKAYKNDCVFFRTTASLFRRTRESS